MGPPVTALSSSILLPSFSQGGPSGPPPLARQMGAHTRPPYWLRAWASAWSSAASGSPRASRTRRGPRTPRGR
eukprot:14861455-Alexandrium_andersonii.AAC.1